MEIVVTIIEKEIIMKKESDNIKTRIRHGRNKGGAFGPGGYCVCANCGNKIPHHRGLKCTTIKCPACQHTMVREELLNN